MKEIETKSLLQNINESLINIHTQINECIQTQERYNIMIEKSIGSKKDQEQTLKFYIDHLQAIIDANTQIVNKCVEISKIIKKASN